MPHIARLRYAYLQTTHDRLCRPLPTSLAYFLIPTTFIHHLTLVVFGQTLMNEEVSTVRNQDRK